LPNLLENVVKNIEYFDRVAIFEIGKVFLGDLQGARASLNGSELLPRQDTWLTAVCAEKKNDLPFSEVRRALEIISDEYNLPFAVVKKGSPAPWCHPARTADIKLGDQIVGALYELNPVVARNYDLNARAGVLEINLNILAGLKNIESLKYVRPSDFPEVERDLAFIVDEGIEHSAIVTALQTIDPLVKKIELFDMFQGESIGENKKSLAYRLTLSSPERTLNADEAETVIEKIRELLRKKFQAAFRE
jgi:phenylalanyl-tRNA synthetase beta chain